MRVRGQRLLVFVFLVFSFLSSGCSRVWLPESVETAVGKYATKAILKEMPAYSGERWQGYLDRLGKRIASVSERPDFSYRFYIVRSSTVNAFAVPDGSVFVTTGLLELIGKDELALAGVLAHEIGHIARRHGAETLQDTLGYAAISFIIFGFDDSIGRAAGDFAGELMSMGYSRDMELEADLCAVRYLVRLGKPPGSALRFLQLINSTGRSQGGLLERYLSSHPPTTERIDYVKSYIRKLGTDT